MATSIELYEQLKKDVSEETARMIAEILPRAEELATKEDIAALWAGFGEVHQRIDRLEARMFRWIVTFFVPLWIAVFAALVAVVWRI